MLDLNYLDQLLHTNAELQHEATALVNDKLNDPNFDYAGWHATDHFAAVKGAAAGIATCTPPGLALTPWEVAVGILSLCGVAGAIVGNIKGS